MPAAGLPTGGTFIMPTCSQTGLGGTCDSQNSQRAPIKCSLCALCLRIQFCSICKFLWNHRTRDHHHAGDRGPICRHFLIVSMTVSGS